MNRFVHRILKSSTASSIVAGGRRRPTTTPPRGAAVGGVVIETPPPPPHQSSSSVVVRDLVRDEIGNAKLVYFGEYHSESRIVSFLEELVVEWHRFLSQGSSSSSGGTTVTATPRLHLIMEHFSVDMQPLLDRYAGIFVEDVDDDYNFPNDDDDDGAFDALVASYKEDYGTEGHDLMPYRDLLAFCRGSTSKRRRPRGDEKSAEDDGIGVTVRLHGGFIPRNHAGRLNRECPDVPSKGEFFDEMSRVRGYLPGEGDAMRGALFAKSGDDGSTCGYMLRGSRDHRMLVESLMNGNDLYSPGGTAEEVVEEDPETDGSSMSRLYQAQLLKDHAMGYRIASLMLDHHRQCSSSSSSSTSSSSRYDDRYVVVAGFGHLKHRLGVPFCVEEYLRSEAAHHPDERRRREALDVLLGASRPIPPGRIRREKYGGVGSATIGCQMLYEAYLEDTYPPMMDDAVSAIVVRDDDNDDDDAKARVRRKALKDLYLRRPDVLDEHVLMSREVSGPLLHYADGVAGFEHPCADYMYVYDEDDDNVIDEADHSSASEERSECPHLDVDAKEETARAYERVGRTAGLRGNVARARAIMSRIGYTTEDMDYVGDDDIYNYQGVAYPHLVAGIRRGEAVLDVGSGLGIDSFLATRDCGADDEECQRQAHELEDEDAFSAPFVVGIDLAESEVQHATRRAMDRGLDVPRRVRFIRGDLEKLEDVFSSEDILPMLGMFDVCISNGAFCLIPDKYKAFGSVFRALKPGGRMAISTTTIISDGLDPSFEWPVCMRMFAPLESILPICERIGFVNVRIIDAESPMEGYEVPLDEVGTNNEGRFKIHGVYTNQYEFLQKMNMDELCKVVTVYGEKP